MRKIKIGDIVHYKSWGSPITKEAKVEGIEICRAGTKYGRQVEHCDLDKHSEVVPDLDDDHWCYKYQITKIEGQ